MTPTSNLEIAPVDVSYAVDQEMRRLIVTIDGPAGTGKSSVARDLARELSLEFLDTGAMYRATTALAIDHGVGLTDEAGIERLLRDADLFFHWNTDPPTLTAFGKSIMHRLRDHDVTTGVTPVSQLPRVRHVLVDAQRRIGEAHPRLVSEGRDQGSVVFRDAEVKIYLYAAPAVRARRRADQLRAAAQHADESQIERELIQRDHSDSTRAVGPLVVPPDSVQFDTSTLDQRSVVAELAKIVRERAPAGALESGVARA